MALNAQKIEQLLLEISRLDYPSFSSVHRSQRERFDIRHWLCNLPESLATSLFDMLKPQLSVDEPIVIGGPVLSHFAAEDAICGWETQPFALETKVTTRNLLGPLCPMVKKASGELEFADYNAVTAYYFDNNDVKLGKERLDMRDARGISDVLFLHLGGPRRFLVSKFRDSTELSFTVELKSGDLFRYSRETNRLWQFEVC